MSEAYPDDEFSQIIRGLDLQPKEVVADLSLAYYSLDRAAHAAVDQDPRHEPVDHEAGEIIIVKHFVGDELCELYIDRPENWIQVHEEGAEGRDKYVQDHLDPVTPPTVDQLEDMRFVTTMLEQATMVIEARNCKVQIVPPKEDDRLNR